MEITGIHRGGCPPFQESPLLGTLSLGAYFQNSFYSLLATGGHEGPEPLKENGHFGM